MTRRLVARLHYLDGDWVALEEFVQRRFDAQTSHGICPSCRAEQRQASAAKRASEPRPVARPLRALTLFHG